MRIDNIKKVHDVYGNSPILSDKKVKKTQQRDKVELSNEAKEFASVYKKALVASDVREDKIADIKARMDNGTYNVKSEDVANKILSRFNIKG